MPAPKGSADIKKSTLITMFVFIFLFLVAGVLAVLQFVKNEELNKKAREAEEELKKIASPNELNSVKSMGGAQKTVLSKIGEDMNALARYIGGEELAGMDIPSLRPTVEQRLQPLWDQLKVSVSNPAEADPAMGLIKAMTAVLKDNQMLKQRFAQGKQENEQQILLLTQQMEQKDAQIEQMNKDLAQASQSALTSEKTYGTLIKEKETKYEDIVNRLNSQLAELQQKQKQAEEQIKSQTEQIEKSNKEVQGLKDQLAQYRPSPETEMAAIVPDGAVVEVVAQEKLAYINLAKNDHIYRGLTFSVYDSFRQIPKSGEGKGTLEVIEIMDTISKCRITQYDPTNPIMAGDIIANLVWDKDKKFLFCVIGDFDFDGDGRIDADGRTRITQMIEAWGGKVSSAMSVDTDFLVLGNPPVLPPRPTEDFTEESSSEAMKQYRKAEQELLAYQQVQTQGEALRVPTFNLSRFLYFIGYY